MINIVLEGADGSGKTHLARTLVSEGYKYEHTGPPEKISNKYYMEFVQKYPQGGAVFDRLHVSSFVYGNVFRNFDDLSPYDHWIIEGALFATSSVMVYVRPPDEVMDKDIEKGPADKDADLYEKPESQQAVRDLYDLYMNQLTSLPVLTYDYTEDPSAEALLADLRSLDSYFSACDMPVGSASPFGNQYSPLYCLVGSKPTPYLFKTLRAVGILLSQICIVESLPDDFALSENWLNVQFVSLGRRANSRLDHFGIAHTSVQHPGLVEAMHYKEMIRYGNAIKGEGGFPLDKETSPVQFPTLIKTGFVIPGRK